MFSLLRFSQFGGGIKSTTIMCSLFALAVIFLFLVLIPPLFQFGNSTGNDLF